MKQRGAPSYGHTDRITNIDLQTCIVVRETWHASLHFLSLGSVAICRDLNVPETKVPTTCPQPCPHYISCCGSWFWLWNVAVAMVVVVVVVVIVVTLLLLLFFEWGNATRKCFVGKFPANLQHWDEDLHCLYG